ncbi:Two component regulator propeller [Flavobacterium micromati]|uniref:Two component regulator propeller n=1 Tax=Flavobacterium micromati TaxID=229205 RepID=A0A1M5HZ42_9FLAO|nr:histidine kinase [Flavobacterium micromati]SHG21235.1 Two component regulator propeller [Flavobacterium micromati]
MPLRIRFSLCFLFLAFQSLLAQYFPSKNYSTTDGLPNNAVRALFLDSKSVLWIGTENGVAIMENGSFLTIDESNGLGHNSCWDISQDANGKMWFASYGGGVSKYDGKKFTVFTTKNGLPADKTRKVFPFKNKMYVGTEQGVSIIDINSHKVVTPKVPAHKEDFICISFFEYKNEVYFTSIFEGLFKIDESGKTPQIISIKRHEKSYCLGLFGTTLYTANDGFLSKFDIQNIANGNWTSSKFGKSVVWQFAQDKRNSIYAAAWGIFSPDGGLYRILDDEMIDVSDFYGIDSKVILNVVYDKSKDILYVGSNDKGVYEVRLDQMIDYNSFKGKSIIDFEVFNDQKLILHNRGISFLDSKGAILKTVLRSDFKNSELSFLKKGKNSVSKQGVESRDFELNFNIPADAIEFYEMVKHKNSIWVSSNIGIFEINQHGKIIAYIPKHSLKFGFTTNDKFIETITYAGVRVYDDIYNLKGKHYSKFEKNTPQYIVKILNNNNKTYLLSVFNGLYVFHNNQFQSYLADGIWKEKKFKHITVNEKGQLILAAEFGNVFIVDDKKSFEILKTIAKKDLVGNTILFLEAYKDFILIGTEKGLNIYHNGIIRLIDKEQGLKDGAVTTSQIFENQLWLGTKNGYYVVDLDKVVQEQITVDAIGISSLAINGIALPKEKYRWFQYASNKLVCDYKNNSFAINFIPKGHLFPNKLKYRYRLKSSNRWSPYSDKTNLYLSYLPYGNYTIEVEVFDSNAGKATIFKLLNIQIQPPFWLTWWFIVLFCIVIICFLVTIILRYKFKAKEKARIEKRIAETESDVLLNQMNPHFMFNAINTIQHFIISNDVDSSLNFVSKLSGLMRQTLENSLEKRITIAEEINYLKGYIQIENMRFGNRIAVDFQIDPNIDCSLYKIPTMTLQPFVENVFVHAFNDNSQDPKLQLSFQMKTNAVMVCKIIDNGKGSASFTKVKLHKSKGISLTKERLSLLQPEIENPITIEYSETQGTTVYILLAI